MILWSYGDFSVPLHEKETMVITRYYTNDESLNKCDEPYRSVVELLDQLKNETPDGCENMSFPSFTLCHIVSAVRTVYEKLRNNLLIFNSTLIKIRSAMTSTRNSIDYDNFYLTIPSSQALLFGAVYYVAAHDSTFKDKQLEAIAKFSCQNKPSTAIFQYFKEPADQKRKEMIVYNHSEQVREKPLPPSKRVIVKKGRYSDFARVVKTMVMDDYFVHEDGSLTNATEVGTMMLDYFGIENSWDSVLQAAFRVENIKKTFDALLERGNEYLISVGNPKKKS